MSNNQFDPELGWMPAIPLPYYGKTWLFRDTFRCHCGEKFRTERDYQIHYVLSHGEVPDEH